MDLKGILRETEEEPLLTRGFTKNIQWNFEGNRREIKVKPKWTKRISRKFEVESKWDPRLTDIRNGTVGIRSEIKSGMDRKRLKIRCERYMERIRCATESYKNRKKIWMGIQQCLRVVLVESTDLTVTFYSDHLEELSSEEFNVFFSPIIFSFLLAY